MDALRLNVRNSAGISYICSDIHGHFSLLAELLKQVNFNEKTDRLFSLGDLIDRGDESAQALEWLAKPWFFAIQGNHERMLINAYESRSESLWFQWMMWGGSWAEDMDFDELEPFYREFSQLPLAIELALPDGKSVGLVHAELPDACDWNEVKQLLTHIEPSQVEAVYGDSETEVLFNSGAKFDVVSKERLPGDKWHIRLKERS